jgi:tricorn protease
MSQAGYYRFPTIHNETIVFVSEDDLWSVPVSGGRAERLTANAGTFSTPFFSPDGSLIAFTGRDEGHTEVYVMDAEGGPVRRLTYMGVSSSVIGWKPDGSQILFSSDHEQGIDRIGVVYGISPEGGMPVKLPIGQAVSISVAPDGRTVIGRNNNDPARWKRYKGGTAGDIWVDAEGNGQYRRLISLEGNIARPMWIGDKIYFLSDHEGIANIYSCSPDGSGLKQHTFLTDFFARFPSADGTRIVFHAGAELYVLDTATDTVIHVPVKYGSSFPQRQRKFVDASKYLQSYALSPKGDSVALTARGKAFSLPLWSGPVKQLDGDYEGPQRLRLSAYLSDGKRVISVSDRTGEEVFEIHDTEAGGDPILLEGLDIGKAWTIKPSPVGSIVAFSNHRNQLMTLDVDTRELKQVDVSKFASIGGFNWSPDGKWIAYGFSGTAYTSAIKLYSVESGETTEVTRPLLLDSAPAFDPDGKYLYFIGAREFNPVYDSLHFDLSFPKGLKPYLITLQANLPDPFKTVSAAAPAAKPEAAQPAVSDPEKTSIEEPAAAVDEKPAEKPADQKTTIKIDLDGIADRVIAFPVSEGLYGQIAGASGKALYTVYPVEGALRQGKEEPARGTLECYDFKEQKSEPIASKVAEFDISLDGKSLIYRSARRLRVVPAGVRPDDKVTETGKKSGWLDLSRVKVCVNPGAEYEQMAREAWRLQRDNFWTENMSGIDWTAVWNKYSPLITRIGSRGEFSDLMWEMQGELGTSHAYEMGGDYRAEPSYPQGFLGANITAEQGPDAGTTVYKITRVLRGDAGDDRRSSPLLAPGVNAKDGDLLIAINGRKLTAEFTPYQALTNLAGQQVAVTLQTPGEEPRTATVTTLSSETALRYRDWVETNRRFVHEATGGRVGYVHVPDMGPNGYAEFHRLYLAEVDRDALIVDVRFNRGGHVSQLLIEKLNRKRVGYDIPRWSQPEPYPGSSVAGPIVALTNQFAGSDGDIFSHVFKLMNLGALIGKRTWGGVIGIWPRHPLADGAVTTQPEYSFWFKDVGWGVENYGTDPHIDIDIAPQDYANGYDPQMEKAIEVILAQLEENPVVRPSFDNRPNLALPWQS